MCGITGAWSDRPADDGLGLKMASALLQQWPNSEGKWLLRRVLDRYAPRALMERRRMGFVVPIEHWFSRPLARVGRGAAG